MVYVDKQPRLATADRLQTATATVTAINIDDLSAHSHSRWINAHKSRIHTVEDILDLPTSVPVTQQHCFQLLPDRPSDVGLERRILRGQQELQQQRSVGRAQR